MRYLVDVIVKRKVDFEVFKSYEEYFDDVALAHERRDKIEEEVDKQNEQVISQDGVWISWSKVVPVVKCSCGEEVRCYNFTNECDCGCDYNFAGQLLASREQWGAETGESPSDCF
jgi:hypothetical protein